MRRCSTKTQPVERAPARRRSCVRIARRTATRRRGRRGGSRPRLSRWRCTRHHRHSPGGLPSPETATGSGRDRHEQWLYPGMATELREGAICGMTVRLSEFKLRKIIVDCWCGRKGRYDRDRTITKMGDITFERFLAVFAGNCPDEVPTGKRRSAVLAPTL